MKSYFRVQIPKKNLYLYIKTTPKIDKEIENTIY